MAFIYSTDLLSIQSFEFQRAIFIFITEWTEALSEVTSTIIAKLIQKVVGQASNPRTLPNKDYRVRDWMSLC